MVGVSDLASEYREDSCRNTPTAPAAPPGEEGPTLATTRARTRVPHRDHPMLPLPGVVACDLCPTQRVGTDSDARALGWRVYRGPSVTGDWIEAVLCPPCADGGGSAR